MNPSSQRPNTLSLWLTRFIVCLFILLGFSLAHAGERITFYHNDPFGNPVLATDEQGNQPAGFSLGFCLGGEKVHRGACFQCRASSMAVSAFAAPSGSW